MGIKLFIEDKLFQSVQDLIDDVDPSIPENQKQILEEIKSISGNDHIIDSEKEALRLAELYLQKYPHLIQQDQKFTQKDISTYRKYLGVERIEKTYSEEEIKAELDSLLNYFEKIQKRWIFNF
jgi:vacuolar-type H+-ATPase catalytic subunit A/Vma1